MILDLFGLPEMLGISASEVMVLIASTLALIGSVCCCCCGCCKPKKREKTPAKRN